MPVHQRQLVSILELTHNDQNNVNELTDTQETAREQPENARAYLANIEAMQTVQSDERTSHGQDQGPLALGRGDGAGRNPHLGQNRW